MSDLKKYTTSKKITPHFAISKEDNSIYYIFYEDCFCIALSFSNRYSFITIDCTESPSDIRNFKKSCEGHAVTKEEFIKVLNSSFGPQGKKLFFRLWQELFTFNDNNEIEEIKSLEQ